MASPLISILIPAYNAERWIRESLDSALAQTWPRKEIIVVDDGSKDRTLDIARSYEGRKVRVIAQSNAGASAARNTALAQAQGDYIQWLDADDLLAPDKVARQMTVAAGVSPRVLISGPWAYFYRKKQRARFFPSPLWSDHTAIEWMILKLRGGYHMQTGTWLTHRVLAEKSGRFDERLARDNDGEYFARVMTASEGVRFVPDAVVYYRQVSSGSITDMGSSNKKRDSLFLSMKLHIGYVRSIEDSPRVRAASVQYLQNWLLEFYPERPDIVAEARGLAAELGGHLSDPKLPPQYHWLRGVLGWPAAKKLSRKVPQWRLAAAHLWDQVLP